MFTMCPFTSSNVRVFKQGKCYYSNKFISYTVVCSTSLPKKKEKEKSLRFILYFICICCFFLLRFNTSVCNLTIAAIPRTEEISLVSRYYSWILSNKSSSIVLANATLCHGQLVLPFRSKYLLKVEDNTILFFYVKLCKYNQILAVFSFIICLPFMFFNLRFRKKKRFFDKMWPVQTITYRPILCLAYWLFLEIWQSSDTPQL